LTQELPLISTPDAILRIKKLIQNKQGDAGRLQYISERLQNGKKLFHSDHIYLTNKISADVIPVQLKEPTEQDEKIKGVKRLIAIKFGDPGRLRYILQTLQKNKELYHSDDVYLESKIEQFHEYTEGKKIKRKVRIPKQEPIQDEFYQPVEEQPKVEPLAQDIPEKLQGIEDAVLSQEPKHTSDLFDLIDDTPKVDLEIQQEREKISKLKHNHEQIKIQHDELSQLIAYRQEYEQKINQEKEILEKEIKIEQQKVKEKDQLVADLIKNQSQLLQSKTEREVLLEQINIDKEKSEKDLAEMQKELDELKQEYEELQKEINTKKENLERQIKEQKEKNEKLREESEEE
jgi:DNA repair exonuclease SbcCD ATPase subunit